MTTREEIHGSPRQTLACRENCRRGEKVLDIRRLKENDAVDSLQQDVQERLKNTIANLPT